jgi:YidC/Oxa1 family membrane protein insertase
MLTANILQPLSSVEEIVLEGLHSIGLGWGLAIVGLTLLVRASTLPLIVRQFRSQRELRLHMPELKRLREEHKDDRARLQQETLAYYREHRINPLSSLLPLLIQVPIFISLYLLLRSDASSGVFGDSGFLFIPSLTEKPHGYILAVMILLYLATQMATSAIATRTLQSNHRGIAMTLPLLFVWVIARFPAGLAIYSITTSLWSLGQQLFLWRASRLPPRVEPLVAGEPASLTAPREPVAERPPAPTHSRSKKKKRSRSRRARV